MAVGPWAVQRSATRRTRSSPRVARPVAYSCPGHCLCPLRSRTRTAVSSGTRALWAGVIFETKVAVSWLGIWVIEKMKFWLCDFLEFMVVKVGWCEDKSNVYRKAVSVKARYLAVLKSYQGLLLFGCANSVVETIVK